MAKKATSAANQEVAGLYHSKLRKDVARVAYRREKLVDFGAHIWPTSAVELAHHTRRSEPVVEDVKPKKLRRKTNDEQRASADFWA